MAVLYVFSCAAPAIALSFNPAMPVQCLLEDERAAPAIVHASAPHGHGHAHGVGTAHHHHDDASRHEAPAHTHHKGDAAACCGMLFLNGVVAEHRIDVARILQNGHAFLITSETLSGRGPERINKPPIDLLPL
jgi:hypothetical protein